MKTNISSSFFLLNPLTSPPNSGTLNVLARVVETIFLPILTASLGVLPNPAILNCPNLLTKTGNLNDGC